MPNRKISQVLNRNSLVKTGPRATVRDAAMLMSERNFGALVVMDDHDQLIGIFTEHDLLVRVVAPGLDADTMLMQDVMTAHPVTISVDDKVGLAMAEMHENNLRHLPVLDRGRVVGILTMRDFVGTEICELEKVKEFEERIWETAL